MVWRAPPLPAPAMAPGSWAEPISVIISSRRSAGSFSVSKATSMARAIRGSSTLLGVTGTGKSPIDGSIRGRAGFAVDRALFYATGGAAFTSFNYSNSNGDSSSNARVGYTVGGGIEYAVTNDWSVRAEYRYSAFGTFTDALPITGVSVTHRETENQVLAGFSYKFASPVAPVVARY